TPIRTRASATLSMQCSGVHCYDKQRIRSCRPSNEEEMPSQRDCMTYRRSFGKSYGATASTAWLPVEVDRFRLLTTDSQPKQTCDSFAVLKATLGVITSLEVP